MPYCIIIDQATGRPLRKTVETTPEEYLKDLPTYIRLDKFPAPDLPFDKFLWRDGAWYVWTQAELDQQAADAAAAQATAAAAWKVQNLANYKLELKAELERQSAIQRICARNLAWLAYTLDDRHRKAQSQLTEEVVWTNLKAKITADIDALTDV